MEVETRNEPATLWIMLDVSNCMRGATIESALNVLRQYVLGPLSGSGKKVSLITFGNTASLLTENPVEVEDFIIPNEFNIGGLCNLSDAISICKTKVQAKDEVLVLTKGYTTDSYGDRKSSVDNNCHIVLLDCAASKIPVYLNSYFSGHVCVYNMQDKSLDELTKHLSGNQ